MGVPKIKAGTRCSISILMYLTNVGAISLFSCRDIVQYATRALLARPRPLPQWVLQLPLTSGQWSSRSLLLVDSGAFAFYNHAHSIDMACKYRDDSDASLLNSVTFASALNAVIITAVKHCEQLYGSRGIAIVVTTVVGSSDRST